MTLKELRLKRGLKLRQVADGMGICLSSVCKYERGANRIPDNIYHKFCEFYGVDSFDNVTDKYIELTDENARLKYDFNNKVYELEQEIKRLKKENDEMEKKYRVIIKEKDSYIKNLESQILNFNNRQRRLTQTINAHNRRNYK